MWANDGVCDDGSRGARGVGGGDKAAPGKGGGGGAWWEDDDLGGWYSDEVRDEGYEDKYGYGYYDDQYGYYGDDTAMPACVLGTDCTDCGGPLSASAYADGTGQVQGDWDDDEWFDDDSEEWWDDDYDFGDGWKGFEDDKDADVVVGILSSTTATKPVNKRHRPKGAGAAGSGEGSFLETHATLLLAAAAFVAVALCLACSPLKAMLAGGADRAPGGDVACGFGKRKQAQA
mmetsp:Transcript_5327/g.21971  ORF Transcript_5327/g.21971 Transcript_5327/m.21971 type:complete len:231 (+) Transcript_5327:2-694(+)